MEVVARLHVGRLWQKYLEGFPITDTFSIQKKSKEHKILRQQLFS